MENKFTNIDDVFRKLQNFQAEPPAYVWDNISNALDKAGNKRKYRLWWLFGSGAAVLVAFVSGYYLSNLYKPTQTADNAQKTEQIRFADNQLDDNSTGNLLSPTNQNHSLPANSFSKANTDYSQAFEKESSTHTQSSESSMVNSHSTIKEQDKTYTATKNTQSDKTPVQESKSPDNITDITSPNSNEPVNTENTKDILGINQDNNKLNEVILEKQNEQVITDDTSDKTEKENKLNGQVAEIALQSGAKTDKIDLYEGTNPPNMYFPLISISPFFSPMYIIRNSSNNESIYDPIYPSTNGRFEQTTHYSYQAGVLLGYNFTRSVSLHIGCSYNQITHSVSKYQLQSKPFGQAGNDSMLVLQTGAGELEGIFCNPNTDNPDAGPVLTLQDGIMQQPIERVVQTFAFVEVPVLVKYRFAVSRVGFLFTGGFSTGFTVRNDAYAENEFESVRFGQTRDIRNVNFNLVLGAGIDVQITPWMYFTFEPTFRYSLMNWSTRDGVKMNPIMIGANTGLSFRF